ncbi:hypothetical protein MPH_02959, partial [Macrophomina phaseolina MS6]
PALPRHAQPRVAPIDIITTIPTRT